MKILNLGSLNIDKVYNVDHFVQAGETISSRAVERFPGGKGMNQSIALARAGAEVYHAGAVGKDGGFLREMLREAGVHTDYLQTLDGETGHAIIQLSPRGQNCIIISAGANGQLTEDYIDQVLTAFGEGDLLLVQNETSGVAYAMEQAKRRGMKIAFNASPINDKLTSYPLHLVDYYLINEVEGTVLAGSDGAEEMTSHREILDRVAKQFPKAAIVLTVGEDGVLYRDPCITASHGIYRVQTVDTTSAGDTFCGYFLACMAKGLLVEEGLEMASKASAMAVSCKGEANSIPTWEDVEAFSEKTCLAEPIRLWHKNEKEEDISYEKKNCKKRNCNADVTGYVFHAVGGLHKPLSKYFGRQE